MKNENNQNSSPATESPATEPPASTEAAKPSPAGQRMSLRIPFVVVIAVTLLSGIVHGVMDGRWSKAEDLIATGSRLQELPEQIGDWSLIETRELEENAVEMLRCFGSVVRVYRHEHTDAAVTVAVLYGPRGPIAVHTPEICYSSVGTEQVGERKIESIYQPEKNSFWSVQFLEKPSSAPSLDVWYGWSDGGDWIAAKLPRVWLTDYLYKIQVAGPVGDGVFRPCDDFLNALLPSLKPLIE